LSKANFKQASYDATKRSGQQPTRSYSAKIEASFSMRSCKIEKEIDYGFSGLPGKIVLVDLAECYSSTCKCNWPIRSRAASVAASGGIPVNWKMHKNGKLIRYKFA